MISSRSPESPDTWSGITASITKQLRFEFDVHLLSADTIFSIRMLSRVTSILRRLGIRYNEDHSVLRGVLFRFSLLKKLREMRTNNATTTIVSVASVSETLFIPRNYRHVLITDAVFSMIHNQYSRYSGLNWISTKESYWVDEQALRRADQVIFSSSYALERCLTDYSIKQHDEHLKVVSFGYNLPSTATNAPTTPKELRLFFPSVDWYRKGGDIAISFCNLLSNEFDGQVHLTAISNDPNIQSFSTDRLTIEIHPPLRRSDPKTDFLLSEWYTKADFIILPVRNDIAPIAVAESYAFGKPVLTTPVGNLEYMVHDEKSGFVDPRFDETLARKVVAVKNDVEGYLKMSEYCTQLSLTEFNWEAWFEQVKTLI